MTLDHKTTHKGKFFEIEIYTSSESWINTTIINTTIDLESEGAKNQNIEKIAFKVVEMKFLAMQITNQNVLNL